MKETTELDNARRFHDKKEDREGFEVRHLPVKGIPKNINGPVILNSHLQKRTKLKQKQA